MDKDLLLSTHEFYRCSILEKNPEYGMYYANGVIVEKDDKRASFPIYAVFINRELIEFITGIRIKLVRLSDPYKYNYSSRSYDELSKLKQGYYYVYNVWDERREEVSKMLDKIEENDMFDLYEQKINAIYQEQAREISEALESKTKH